MGWMTLHSVATCYPESPTQSEKDLMASWLDMFRDTMKTDDINTSSLFKTNRSTCVRCIIL